MNMTIPDMLRRTADMLEQDQGFAALMAVEHTLKEVQSKIYRARPGLEIDRMLGTKENAND